ncbi:hypothetical protein DFQ01_12172 [Paenibacillus cellulosilyticus]|uniref:Uncharacterized protein n=1 Tax=Paenibacillus cellulosilyticus TaxID=375489 RepID=A0A2V2YRA6_9BACL|nr:hypothetical protein DFQ01_12172 [Paenibacillus cellulosilyticus]
MNLIIKINHHNWEFSIEVGQLLGLFMLGEGIGAND